MLTPLMGSPVSLGGYRASGFTSWGVGGGGLSWVVVAVGVGDAAEVASFESVAVSFEVHHRNAKLIFGAVLRFDGRSAGLYSRPEMRVRALRRPAVTADLSSNDYRTV
jgi:hypothetical protein